MKDWTEGTGHKGKSPTLYPTKYETWSQSPLWFWIRAEHRLLCIKTKLTLHQRCKHYSRCICVKVTEDKMQKNMKDIFLAWLPQYRTLQFSLSYFSRAKYDLVLWWTLMWRRPWCWSKSGMILFISLIIAVSLAAQMRTNLILWLVTLNVAELQDVSGHKWVSNQLVHKLIYYSYQSSSFLFIFYVFIFFQWSWAIVLIMFSGMFYCCCVFSHLTLTYDQGSIGLQGYEKHLTQGTNQCCVCT